MAAERYVRGPVHREDGQAKTFSLNVFYPSGPRNEPGQVCLARGLPLRVTYITLH